LCFDHIEVMTQWTILQQLFQKYLSDMFVLLGFASDGDSRRRKAMLSKYASASAQLYRLPVSEFTFSAGPGNINDQDFLHNARKLLNCLTRGSRSIVVGDLGLAVLGHLRVLMNETDTHGIRQGDEDRKGYLTMDTRSMVRVTNPMCTNGLQSLIDQGHAELRPLFQVLVVIRRYISIFLSKRLSYFDRIKNSAFVLTYLRLWRKWIQDSNGRYTLKSNFITNEAFIDTCISCHAVINAFRVARDYCDDLMRFDVSRLGTYCCEKQFSELGGFVGNRRVYSFLGGLRMLRKKMRALECASESSVVLSRSNKPLTEYWQEDGPEKWQPDVVLDDQTMTQAWIAGSQLAMEEARLHGMIQLPPLREVDELSELLSDDNWDVDTIDEADSKDEAPTVHEQFTVQKLKEWICRPGGRPSMVFANMWTAILKVRAKFIVVQYDYETSSFGHVVASTRQDKFIGHFPGTEDYVLLNKVRHQPTSIQQSQGRWSGVATLRIGDRVSNMQVKDVGSWPFGSRRGCVSGSKSAIVLI
jgi:hypothetical protein